jgi:hypothetical protein
MMRAVGSCLLFCNLLSAQATLGVGAVRGAVSDPSGEAIDGAAVTLTETSKGLVRETESSGDGSFVFLSVLAGDYSVRVEKTGFTTERMNDLHIEVGQQASIALHLRLGEAHDSVTVDAPNETELDAESNAQGSVIDSSRVRDLPLNGRYFLQLTSLSGGVTEVNAASNVFTSNIGLNGRLIVLPGGFPYSASFSLNGFNIKSSRDGELALSPSVAAIDQFKVEDSFLLPDEGSGSAVINVVTKSGTNQYHGEVFEFFRNKVLDARSFFAPERENLKRNQFGGAIGGPIVKNRIWFHTFYEGLREMTAFSAAGYTPTADMFAGDFSATRKIIYDPAGYQASSGTRTPFPNSLIPLSRMNSVSRNLLAYYRPGSSLASMPSNFFANPLNTVNDDQGGARLDFAVSPRSQLFFQLFKQNTPSVLAGLFPLSGMLYQNESTLAMVQHSWAINAQSVNTLRFGFLRNVAIGTNEAQEQGPILDQIGITNTFDRNGVSAINLQGYSSFGKSNGEVGNRDNTWQLDEEFAYTLGRHSFAAGAGIRYRRGWHLNGNASAVGSVTFQSAFTAQLAANAQGLPVPVAGTGDSFADFLLGYPTSGNLNGLPVVEIHGAQFTPYIQDTWKLTRNLTLNYGVSWFMETPPKPQGWAQQLVHSFDPQTGLVTFAGLGQTSPQTMVPDRNNLAPRLGLAWQPDFLRGTVIRASAGTYYSEFPWLFAAYPVISPSPVGAGQSFTNALTSPVPTYSLGTNVFPPPLAAGLTNSYASSLPQGTNVTLLNRNSRTTYSNQWNFSIQRNVGRNNFLELSYLGSSTHRLPNVEEMGQCRPIANLLCAASTRPWPRYGTMIYDDGSGNASYQAVIAKYEHRIDHSLNLHVEYAFAKSLSDAWQALNGSSNQITTCRACSKGPNTFDVRSRLIASGVWQLPFDHWAPNGWINQAVGGWNLMAITTFSTGEPISMKAPNQTGSPFITPLPNRVCNGQSDALSGNIKDNGFLWFDTSCFTIPAVGYFGNSAATVLYGPGIENIDLAIQKSLMLPKEVGKLQFRADMFNAWNHEQFMAPSGDAGAGVNFGRISAARTPRLIQLALKVMW